MEYKRPLTNFSLNLLKLALNVGELLVGDGAIFE